jgi:hypothetical protein
VSVQVCPRNQAIEIGCNDQCPIDGHKLSDARRHGLAGVIELTFYNSPEGRLSKRLEQFFGGIDIAPPAQYIVDLRVACLGNQAKVHAFGNELFEELPPKGEAFARLSIHAETGTDKWHHRSFGPQDH